MKEVGGEMSTRAQRYILNLSEPLVLGEVKTAIFFEILTTELISSKPGKNNLEVPSFSMHSNSNEATDG